MPRSNANLRTSFSYILSCTPQSDTDKVNIVAVLSRHAFPADQFRVTGMHEILAPLYHAVHFDSIMQSEEFPIEDSELAEICSRLWVAADAWMLFDVVMRGISKWYEWRESALTSPTDIISPVSPRGRSSLPDGHVEIKPYIAPIVETCDRIQSQILRTTDPLLYRHMQALGIEPQIYGM